MRIDELVDGLVDADGEDIVAEEMSEEEELEEIEEDEARRTPTWRAPTRAAQERLPRALQQDPAPLQEDAQIRAEKGYRSRAYKDLQESISGELLMVRFTAKQVEHLCGGLRQLVERVRGHEREIMDLCTRNARCRARTSSRCSPQRDELKW